jgi:hypothetical protein
LRSKIQFSSEKTRSVRVASIGVGQPFIPASPAPGETGYPPVPA